MGKQELIDYISAFLQESPRMVVTDAEVWYYDLYDMLTNTEDLDDLFSYDTISSTHLSIYSKLTTFELSRTTYDVNQNTEGVNNIIEYGAVNGNNVIAVVLCKISESYNVNVNFYEVDGKITYKDHQSEYEMFVDEKKRRPESIGEFACYLVNQCSVYSTDVRELDFNTYEEAKKCADKLINAFNNK